MSSAACGAQRERSMRHGKRGRAAAVSQEWADVQAHCLWPDQALYELVRPVVLLGKPVRERARETGVSEKTLTRRTHQFIQHGLPGFRAPPGLRDDDGRLLPGAVRDFLLVRKAEWPALSAFALARL